MPRTVQEFFTPEKCLECSKNDKCKLEILRVHELSFESGKSGIICPHFNKIKPTK